MCLNTFSEKCTFLFYNIVPLSNTKTCYLHKLDKNRLIASPEDFNTWFLTENNTIFIPCRPTSPDVDVELTIKYTDKQKSVRHFMYTV